MPTMEHTCLIQNSLISLIFVAFNKFCKWHLLRCQIIRVSHYYRYFFHKIVFMLCFKKSKKTIVSYTKCLLVTHTVLPQTDVRRSDFVVIFFHCTQNWTALNFAVNFRVLIQPYSSRLFNSFCRGG